jgi:peptide/nickel transport system ATP-binding protein
MTLLRVDDLSVRFGRDRPVVRGLSFEVEAGECVALVGQSGSGKSVTARALLGLAGDGVNAAALEFEGLDLLRLPERRMRRLRGSDIGYVSQGALVALDPLRPVGREVADSLRLHSRMSAAARAQRAIELLAEVGVPDPAGRARERPDRLSGGLRQRAVIASAIAMRPRLLIADEPTTALDATVAAGILRLLDRLREDGTAVLLISHDLATVSAHADRVVVLRDGEAVEHGPTRRVLRTPTHAYTRELVASVPTDVARGVPLLGGPAWAPTPGPVLLEARGLHKRFGERTALDDVSVSVRAGSTVGVVGESGSGKTTLARVVLALEAPDAGTVTLDGEPWVGTPLARRRRIGAIYQDALSSFDPRWTVDRILADAAPGGRAAVPELLDLVGLPATVAPRRPRLLSGGQQQRVAIARAIAARPAVIVCDEPVSSLDASAQARVLDLLDLLQRELGLAYLFISHDLGVVRHLSDEVLVMHEGRVVESGPTERVFSQPREDYTRALIAAAPRLDRPVGGAG